MDKIQEFLYTVLEHAEPKYYDPVKAHEYYEKTKELKGRQSRQAGVGLNTRQRKAFDYSKSKINEAEDEAAVAALEEVQEKLAEVRERVEVIRTEIRDKLAAILNQLTENRTNRVADILAQRKADILKINNKLKEDLAAVPPLPKNPSQAQIDTRAAKLEQLRNTAVSERESVNNKASEARTAVSNETANEKNLQKESSNLDRQQLTEEFKAVVETASANYETLKAELKAKYEAEIDTEYDAIKKTVR